MLLLAKYVSSYHSLLCLPFALTVIAYILPCRWLLVLLLLQQWLPVRLLLLTFLNFAHIAVRLLNGFPIFQFRQ